MTKIFTLVTLLLLAGAAAMLAGCRSEPPAKWETVIMTRVKHSVTVGDRKQKNPLKDTPENRQLGRQSFSHYCVACHGLDGQNTGVPFASAMSPPVPSLASFAVQSYTDGQLNWVVTAGLRFSGMPASKGILTDEEIWSIVLYLRHLPPAGSVGEPAMYRDAN